MLACINSFESQTGQTVAEIVIKIKSEFPPERGLKTSSGVSTGILSALSMYYQTKLTIPEIIDLSAFASISCGVSITGAIDDAYASFCGGLSYTNNYSRTLHFLKEISNFAEVLLLIPTEKKPKEKLGSMENVDLSLLNKARNALISGDYEYAITWNTDAYSKDLLKDPEIIDDLRRLNYGVVGLNGAGPSLFIVLNRLLTTSEVEVISSSFSRYKTILTSIRNKICDL